METVRAFIAVEIGDEIREKLYELQRRLKKVHANVRWVNPGNIHLTLAFLGDLPAGQIDRVGKVMDDACAGQTPFDLEAAGTGFFGKRSHPRVVWAGIVDNLPLQQLQHHLVRALIDAGVGYDAKAFSPHLTLGRVKTIDRHTGPLIDKIEQYRETGFGSVCIDRVELIRSLLAPRGPEYAILHRTALMP